MCLFKDNKFSLKLTCIRSSASVNQCGFSWSGATVIISFYCSIGGDTHKKILDVEIDLSG